MTKRNIAAFAVALLMVLMCTWYSYLIISGEVKPVLATWLLFSVATTLGIVTYFSEHSRERSAITNIANTVDVVVIWLIFLTLVTFGKDVRVSFTYFEIGCLAATVLVLAAWLTYRNKGALVANLAVNVIMFVAVLPTIIHLWSAAENTESPVLWGVVWVAAIVALYNPLKEKDLLAAVYALRAIISVSVILALMFRIEMQL